MDVDMRDATRGGRAPRRSVSGNQRAAPYSRGDASLSIKGASGPTWVVVANLVKGTTPEDLKRYTMRDLPSNAVAFELGFEKRSDAVAACDKYDGVLADGRVLQVTLQGASPEPRVEPRAQPRAWAADATSRLGVPIAASPGAPAVALPSAPTAATPDAVLPLAQRRQLAEAEARYLREREQILLRKAGPKKEARPAPLKNRLGSLPLAQRLAAEGPKGPQSGKTRKGGKARAKSRGMDMDL
ncbi:hypothetical protein MSPP1_003692 [Malassezia sp. CBS 17886]|nr:hypothetical protein MSPP1_003692 [Malassezia sp. CBS 17886]